MNKVAIVYWSGTGNTEQMAQAVPQDTLLSRLPALRPERCRLRLHRRPVLRLP